MGVEVLGHISAKIPSGIRGADMVANIAHEWDKTGEGFFLTRPFPVGSPYPLSPGAPENGG